MGRIDEAFRRAGASAPGGAAVGADPGDPFISPWALDDAALPQPLTPSSATGAPAPVSATRARVGDPNTVRMPGQAAAPVVNSQWRQRLALAEAADPLLVEQFRRLAATMIHGQRSAPLKVVMVTSAAPEEGKTLTAVNLALVLSESFRHRVLLIDADLRRPKITECANVMVDGLGEAVKTANPGKVPLVQLTETLTLLPAGRPDPDPLSGVTSSRMQQLLEEARATFEWVIVDTPPVGAAADASLLCAMADATVLVVRAGETPYESVQQAIDAIGRERIIGVVLNGVDRRTVPSYADYYGARDNHDQR